MKLISRTLAVVLTTMGAVGTVGGAMMFGIAGTGGLQHPTSFFLNPDTSIGAPGAIECNIGWLNYNAPPFSSAQGDEILGHANITINEYQKIMNFNDFLLLSKAAQYVVNNPSIDIYNLSRSDSWIPVINATAMYDAAIAGIVIMSVGIIIIALSAIVAIKIKNPELIKMDEKEIVE